MSEIPKASRKLVRTTAALLASTALLAGCGGQQQTTVQKERESSQAPYRYENSPARNARITAAIARFSGAVIKQESLPKSTWGHIGVLCNSKSNVYSNDGILPPLRGVKAGDDCTISIGHGNGPLLLDLGTASLGVSGDHGSFNPNDVSGLIIDRLGKADCTASFLGPPTSNDGWFANSTNGPPAPYSSVNQVVQTDNKALACLDITLATLN